MDLIESKEHVEAIYSRKKPYSAKVIKFIKSIDCYNAEMDIYNKKDPITSICCREYHKNKPFRGSAGSGAVAEHKKIYTIAKKHMRNIHNMEIAAYKEHEIVEIHLDAVFDGVFVWPYFGFQFVDRKEEKLISKTLFLSYLSEVHFPDKNEEAKSVARKCKTFKQMKAYCMMKGKTPYTEYLEEHLIDEQGGKVLIQMYKEVPINEAGV